MWASGGSSTLQSQVKTVLQTTPRGETAHGEHNKTQNKFPRSTAKHSPYLLVQVSQFYFLAAMTVNIGANIRKD